MIKNPVIKRGVKNASFLAAGNFLTQIIAFVGLLVIARMLGTEKYGVYVTVGAFVGFFDVLLCNGLNKSILREGSKSISEMPSVLNRTFGLRRLLIIVAIVLCISSVCFAPYDHSTKPFIILFSLRLVFFGVTGFFSVIYQATEKMHFISLFAIADRLIFVTLAITSLYLGYGLLSLFLISILTCYATMFVSRRISNRLIPFSLMAKTQFDWELLKPAIIFTLMPFVGVLTRRIDILMISWIGSMDEVGIYGVAYKIGDQGIMLRNAVAMAFFPIIVRRFQEGRMRGAKLINMSLFFLAIILMGAFVFSIFCEDLITFALGSGYTESGTILKVLVFYLCFWWAALPFTTAAQATHNEKYLLLAWSVMASLKLPLNYFLYKNHGLIGIAYSTLIVYAVGAVVLSVLSYRAMRKQGHLH